MAGLDHLARARSSGAESCRLAIESDLIALRKPPSNFKLKKI
jgi:hypothetical protein